MRFTHNLWWFNETFRENSIFLRWWHRYLCLSMDIYPRAMQRWNLGQWSLCIWWWRNHKFLLPRVVNNVLVFLRIEVKNLLRLLSYAIWSLKVLNLTKLRLSHPQRLPVERLVQICELFFILIHWQVDLDNFWLIIFFLIISVFFTR